MEQGGADRLGYLDRLKIKMDLYAHEAYAIARKMPKDEIFGLSSQLKRAAVSVPLNYIEGYARAADGSRASYKNFLKIAYGSLKESKYVIQFSVKEGLVEQVDCERALILADEVGAMLYKIMI
jgi:four helix bundle protein